MGLGRSGALARARRRLRLAHGAAPLQQPKDERCRRDDDGDTGDVVRRDERGGRCRAPGRSGSFSASPPGEKASSSGWNGRPVSGIRPAAKTAEIAIITIVAIAAWPSDRTIVRNRMPGKRMPIDVPMMSCAAATTSRGGAASVRPARCTAALPIIAPVRAGAGSRKRRAREDAGNGAGGQQHDVDRRDRGAAGGGARDRRHLGQGPEQERYGHDDQEDPRRMGQADRPVVAAHGAAQQDHLVQPARHAGEIRGARIVTTDGAKEHECGRAGRADIDHQGHQRDPPLRHAAEDLRRKALPSMMPRTTIMNVRSRTSMRSSAPPNAAIAGGDHRAHHPRQRQAQQGEDAAAAGADRQRPDKARHIAALDAL